MNNLFDQILKKDAQFKEAAAETPKVAPVIKPIEMLPHGPYSPAISKPMTPAPAPAAPPPPKYPSIGTYAVPHSRVHGEDATNAWWAKRKEAEKTKYINDYSKLDPSDSHRQAGQDAYVARQLEANKYRWDPRAFRKVLGNAGHRGEQEAAKNFGAFTANAKDPNWRANRKRYIDEFHASAVPNDPIERAIYMRRAQGIIGHNKARLNQQEVDTTGGMYLAAKALRGATLNIGGVADNYARKTTGQDSRGIFNHLNTVAPGAEADAYRLSGELTELASSIPTTAAAVTLGGRIPGAAPAVAGNVANASRAAKAYTAGANALRAAGQTYGATMPVKAIANAGENYLNVVEDYTGDAMTPGQKRILALGQDAMQLSKNIPEMAATGSAVGPSLSALGPKAQTGLKAATGLSLFGPPIVDNADAYGQKHFGPYKAIRQADQTKALLEQQTDATVDLNPGVPREVAAAAVQNQIYRPAFEDDERFQALTPQEQGAALVKHYKDMSGYGNGLPANVFSDKRLNPQQRAELFENAMTNAIAGDKKLLGTIGLLFSGDDAKAKAAIETLHSNPAVMDTLVGYGASVIRDSGQEGYDGAAKLTPQQQVFKDKIMKSLPLIEARRLVEEGTKDFTAEQMARSINNNSNDPSAEGSTVRLAYIHKLADITRKDPAKGAEIFLGVMGNRAKDAKPVVFSAEEKAVLGPALESMDATKLSANLSDDNKNKLALHFSKGGTGTDIGLSEESTAKVKANLEKAFKADAFKAIMADPIKGIPNAVALWLSSKGFGTAADYAKNPWVFFMGLAAILGGGAWMLSGSGGGGSGEQRQAPVYNYNNSYR